MSAHHDLARRVSRDTILITLTKLQAHATEEEKLSALAAAYPFGPIDDEARRAWNLELMALTGLKGWEREKVKTFNRFAPDPNQASLF